MKTRESFIITMLVGMLAMVWIVPVVGVVATSLRPISESTNGWWSTEPLTITLDAWRTVWDEYALGAALWMSIKISLLCTFFTVLLTPPAAYALHFLRFRFRFFILVLIVNAFVLPQQVVVLPLFKLWRDWGLIDSMWSVIIPTVGLSFAWSIYLVKSFFEGFPKELIDAAKIDNCGPIATYFYVVLPNSWTPMAAMIILQFLWSWNSILIPLLFLRSELPLPVLLSRIAGAYEPNIDQQSVVALITMVIPLLVFLLMQRYFTLGANTSSGGKE